MSNIGSYEKRIKDFDWSLTEKELDYREGEVINIGWYCSDRICGMGKAGKTALLYEDFTGIEKTFTFNDLRLESNTIGTFLTSLGLKNEDRICLFMDRDPWVNPFRE